MSDTTVTCPLCSGTTDIGGECNSCDFDWQNDNRSEKEKYAQESNRLMKFGTKSELNEFLRHNNYGRSINYAPYDNQLEHDTDSSKCWCEPTIEYGEDSNLIIHRDIKPEILN